MEAVLITLAALAGITAKTIHGRRKRRRLAIQALVKRFGLTHTPNKLFRQWSVVGEYEGSTISIRPGEAKENGQYRIEVRPPQMSPGWTILLRTTASKIGELLIKNSLQTGEPVFDERIWVRAERTEGIAALSQPMRKDLLNFILLGRVRSFSLDTRMTTQVLQGMVQWLFPGPWKDPEEVLARVLLMHRIAQGLSFPTEEIPDRLIKNIWDDAVQDVRLNNFKALATDYPQRAQSEAIKIAEEHTDTKLRLEAALLAGEAGCKTLLKLIKDDATEPQSRLKMVNALAPFITRSDVRETVQKLWVSAEEEIRTAALEAFVTHLPSHSLSDIMAAEGLFQTSAEKVLLARLFGGHQSEQTQFRLRNLISDKDDEVASQACASLGQIGELEDVEPLWNLTQAKRVKRAVKKAAEAAIDQIQSRLKGVAGGVSIADQTTDEGALSLPASDGKLSLDEPH